MNTAERVQPPEMYDAALELVRHGISVIPIRPGTKEPPDGFRWGQYTTRVADASELYEWYVNQGWQIGVVCGAISGDLVVIDFDEPDHADGGFAEHARTFPAIRDLPRVKTGKGRVHVYCRSNEPTVKYMIGRVEVRSGNHYCVAPPSLHPQTGKPYIWSTVQSLDDGIPTIDLRTIGFEPRARAEPVAGEAGEEGQPLSVFEIDRIVEVAGPHWIEGQRYHLALSLAGWMAGYSVPESDADAVILALAAHESSEGQRNALRAVRDTYKRWRAGFAVAGWSMLTDAQAPLISRAAATQLEWLLKGRQASIVFDVPTRQEHPFIISVADLLAEPDEADEWLIQGLLRARSLGLTVGPPKTYKSFLEQELHIAVASGTPAFGLYAASEPQVAVYIQEESSRGALRRRFRWLLNGRGIHPSAIADTLFTVTNQGVELDNHDSMRRLIDEVMRIYEPALITFDPLREVHNADENSSKEMRPILKFLKELRDEFQVSIQLVHHNNKNPLYDNPADSIRGTTSLWGAMDGALFVGTTDDDDVMQVLPRLKEGGGANPFLYTIKQGDDALVLSAFEKPQKGKFDRMAIVAWAREEGRWFVIDDALQAFSRSHMVIREAVRDLVKAGYLIERITFRNKKEYAHPEVDDDATF